MLLPFTVQFESDINERCVSFSSYLSHLLLLHSVTSSSLGIHLAFGSYKIKTFQRESQIIAASSKMPSDCAFSFDSLLLFCIIFGIGYSQYLSEM